MKGPWFKKKPALRNFTWHISQALPWITWSHVYVHFSHWCVKKNKGSAVVAGVNYEMRVVQVHIKFHFYTPQSAQTFSCSESLVYVVNGVVYFDNAVVFGYSVGWRVHLDQTCEIPRVELQVFKSFKSVLVFYLPLILRIAIASTCPIVIPTLILTGSSSSL